MIYFVKIFNLFIHVIILKTSIFKSYVSFGKHPLLDKSLKVLKLTTHVSNLNANGY